MTDPFALVTNPEALTHPELKTCDCGELLIWDVWVSESGARCKAWRCPTKTYGHVTEFV